MGDRKKKIRRMLRGLLKEHAMERLVNFTSREEAFELKVHGVEDFVLFSLEKFINERIDNYEACTYDDLKARMALLNKEIILIRAIPAQKIRSIYHNRTILNPMKIGRNPAARVMRDRVEAGHIINVVNQEKDSEVAVKLIGDTFTYEMHSIDIR